MTTMTKERLPDLDPSKGYLMSMTLENVRCFGSPPEELYMTQLGNPDKPARWTVILGANGVGKTTVLRALAMGRNQNAMITGYGIITPEARMLTRSGVRLGKYKVGTSDLKNWGVRIEGDHTIASIHRDLASPISLNLAAYGAGRAWRGSRENSESSTETLFDRTAQVRDPSQTLADRVVWEGSSQSGEAKVVDKLKAAFVELLPDVSAVELDFDKDKRPFAKFKTKDGWIALDDMSWGYQVFAAFAADYASRLIDWYPDSKEPLKEPGICLVDELDLHMHPKWQREVIDHLSRVFPATQFIVTVHSPLVVQAAEDANLVVLKRYPEDPSRVQIDNDVEAIKGWRIDQVLTSDLFGLESSRPPSVTDDLAERRKLLGKETLTDDEKARLDRLDQSAMAMPMPGSEFEQEALKLVAQAAAKLKQLG